ncbi:three-helix bundle dimerization domain-containing protein [Rhodococcus opacus]
MKTAHHHFDGCQIRDFVPLLVERAASRALDDSLAITPPTACPAVPEAR